MQDSKPLTELTPPPSESLQEAANAAAAALGTETEGEKDANYHLLQAGQSSVVMPMT